MDIVEFKILTSDLVKKNFLFTGREGRDTLDLNQLYILRDHNRKRRKMQKLEEGDKGPDNRQDQMDEMKDKFLVKKQPSEGVEAPKESEPISVITMAQKDELVPAFTRAKTLCEDHFPDLREKDDALQDNFKHFPQLILEMKSKIHEKLQRELKQHGNNRGFESLLDHTENDNYDQYLKVERLETELREVLLSTFVRSRQCCITRAFSRCPHLNGTALWDERKRLQSNVWASS